MFNVYEDPHAAQWAAYEAKQAPTSLFEQHEHIAFPVTDLPPVMKAAAEAIAERVQAPLELAAVTILAAAVSVAQGRINALNHDGKAAPCSMYILALADSGDRKSTCRKLAMGPILEHEKEAHLRFRKEELEWLKELDAQPQKRKSAWARSNPRPLDPKTLFDDASFERIVGHFLDGAPVACWDTDEGGQMLGGHSMTGDNRASIIGGLTKGFDSGEFSRDRAKGNLEGSGKAYGRRFSMTLLAQDVTVRTSLADPVLKGQGFLPRFLFVDCPSIAGTRLTTAAKLKSPPSQAPAIAEWHALLKSKLATPVKTNEHDEVEASTATVSEDAYEELASFYNDMETAQGSLGEYEGIRPFAGRAGEIASRLATVFAFIEGRTDIAAYDMAGACSIVGYSVEQWRKRVEETKPTSELVQAQKLLDWLKEKDWREFTAAKLVKSGPPLARKAKRRDALLAVLCERHWLTIEAKTYKANW